MLCHRPERVDGRFWPLWLLTRCGNLCGVGETRAGSMPAPLTRGARRWRQPYRGLLPAPRGCGSLSGVPCHGFVQGAPRGSGASGGTVDTRVLLLPHGQNHRQILSRCWMFPEAFTACRGRHRLWDHCPLGVVALRSRPEPGEPAGLRAAPALSLPHALTPASSAAALGPLPSGLGSTWRD